MNQHKTLLLVLLLVQLLLAGWLFFGDRLSAEKSTGLVGFEVAAISAVEITDAKNNKLRLERLAGGWRVGDYPANADKVEAMLTKLGDAQAPWPIATSREAQTRFEVAQDKFQRRLQLYQGDQLTSDLLFGTSPGFRQVHVRAAAAEPVYSIDFANHELPLGEDDWLDRGLLALGSDINSVQRLDHFSLVQVDESDDRWELNGGPADPAEVAGLVGRFADLQVLGSVVFEGQLTASFAIGANGQDYRYALYHNVEMDKYYMTRDDQPGRFEMASYIAEQMLLDTEALQPKAAADDEGRAASGLAKELIEQALQSLPQPSQP